MNFQNYSKTGDEIVMEVANELGIPEDKELAIRILRAVLHVIRSGLTFEESYQLMEEFPLFIKGIYVQGWNNRDQLKKIKNMTEFVRAFIHEDRPEGHHDIRTVKDGENAIRAVFIVLKRHISEYKINKLLHSFPTELIPL